MDNIGERQVEQWKDLKTYWRKARWIVKRYGKHGRMPS
jgi:hypothetical protein